MRTLTFVIVLFLLIVSAALTAVGQSTLREFDIEAGGTIEIINRTGRVSVASHASAGLDTSAASSVTSSSTTPYSVDDVRVDISSGRVRIEVVAADLRRRIDIAVVARERTRLKIETRDGEVRIDGDFASAEVDTETGTIAADVPTADVRYDILWTASRPRVVADFEIAKIKEGAGGKFSLKGRHREEKTESKDKDETPAAEDTGEARPGREDEKKKKLQPRSSTVDLRFTTARGIVVLNIPPNEVMSDLRERPLTNAAKAVIRSGDRLLMDAIRRASPKYFGDYARSLPPPKGRPEFAERVKIADAEVPTVKRALVRVTDAGNRAIEGLRARDFSVTENGEAREILKVEQVVAPVNLVLLLDVSGSVDNYVDFIRKAARSFVNTVDSRDRIAIVLFNEDVKSLSGFTLDKEKLSASLDTLDAGGATAYYDALAYALADTLRPLRGERTAIVVLTDGDDNRSFLPFESLIGAIEESGALIYPLYVPSSLVAAAASNPEATVDPLRSRYSGLSAKAAGEGERLAKVSGGVYYPITHVSQIKKAYDDIVLQLRTAYNITFQSTTAASANNLPSPRLKIKSKRAATFASVTSVVAEQR